jgi:hypothetical protein
VFSVSAQKSSLSLVSRQKPPFSCTDGALRAVSARNFPLVQIFGTSDYQQNVHDGCNEEANSAASMIEI